MDRVYASRIKNQLGGARMLSGLSIEQLSHRLDIGASTLGAIERGWRKKINKRTNDKIIKFIKEIKNMY